jgi:diacylglycerol kinase (ATP)
MEKGAANWLRLFSYQNQRQRLAKSLQFAHRTSINTSAKTRSMISIQTWEMPVKGLTATLVFNPNSGKQRAPALAQRFAELWKERTGTEPKLRPTRSYEDIRIASKETYGQSDIQVFLGGDGTLSEAIQGLFEQNGFQPLAKPVGLLPAGTGNSFLRDFGIDNFDSAFASMLRALEQKTPHKVDVGMLTYGTPKGQTKRIVMNIWGIGFIPDVTELAIKLRKAGKFNYTIATLFRALKHKQSRFSITVDGQEETVNCNFITISNSRFTGGSMLMAPPLHVNDGNLFMVCPSIPTRAGLLQLFPKIFTGTHIDNPMVRSQFVKEFSLQKEESILMNVDGELERGFNPTLKAVKSAWNIWVVPHGE